MGGVLLPEYYIDMHDHLYIYTKKEAMEKGLRVNAGKTKVYRPGTPAEFRQIFMCCLSYRIE